MHTLSIIIPYFNREATLARCLDSIGVDRLPGVEVIVVDDFSDTPLQGFADPAITVLRLPKNMGPVAARALGAQHASHGHLMFLDSDDALLPHWFERFCAALDSNPGCDIYAFPDEGYQGNAMFEICSLEQYWQWVQRPDRASDYLITITASAYRKVPMPSVRISELWYIVQLFERGLRACYTDVALFKYYQDSGNQLSKQVFRKFDTSAYTRASLRYALIVFKRQQPLMRRLAKTYHDAWHRRLFKEALLSLSMGSLARLMWSRREIR